MGVTWGTQELPQIVSNWDESRAWEREDEYLCSRNESSVCVWDWVKASELFVPEHTHVYVYTWVCIRLPKHTWNWVDPEGPIISHQTARLWHTVTQCSINLVFVASFVFPSSSRQSVLSVWLFGAKNRSLLSIWKYLSTKTSQNHYGTRRGAEEVVNQSVSSIITFDHINECWGFSKFDFFFLLSCLLSLFLLYVKHFCDYLIPPVHPHMFSWTERNINNTDKMSHVMHWTWRLVFWSLSPGLDRGLQYTQSHFVLASEGPAAHLASRHAPWKKGILCVEDRGIVPHWCMWLLVFVAAATLWYERDTRYKQTL